MDVLIPFARDVQTGEIVSVDDVPSGKACGSECLFCRVPVVARKGDINQHHFAHAPKAVDDDHVCEASFERAVFWMTRRILEDSNQFQLPDYRLIKFNRTHKLSLDKPVTQAQRVTYDAIDAPENHDLSHDRVVLSIKGHHLAITFSFGRAGELKRIEHKGVRVAHLAVRLDDMKERFKEQKTGFREIMTDRIIDGLDQKEWLYHPHEDAVAAEYYREVAEADKALREREEAIEDQRRAIRDRNLRIKSAQRKTGAVDRIRTDDKSATRELIHQRDLKLVDIVEKLFASGVRTGYLCETCRVMSGEQAEQCRHCGQTAFKPIQIDDGYLSHLERKYFCWGYGSESLKVLPDLD